MRDIPVEMRIAAAEIEQEAYLELFEVDLSPLGGDILRFHSGVNQYRHAVVWQKKTYQPYPLEANDFEIKGNGTSNRPSMTFANVTGLITAINNDYQGAIGAIVARRKVPAQALDEINFPNGNPQANPTKEVVSRYVIEQVKEQATEFVTYTLSLPSESDGALIPARVILADICPWIYRSADCGYTGGPVADSRDNPTDDPSKDGCSKRTTGCHFRFPRPNAMPFGGFPGTNKVG